MPPATPSQTIGPFFHVAVSSSGRVRLAADGVPAVRLDGRVLDGDGAPVDDALVELWDVASARFGRCPTDGDGAFAFLVAPPSPPAYLAVSLFARGLLGRLVTRCYLAAPEVEGADAAWDAAAPDRRSTLVAEPAGDGYRFDIHLQGERETVFFAF